MKVFDKIRDLFTEEVDEEEKEEPIKKEVIQVEIPAPEAKKEEAHVEEVKAIPQVQPQPKPVEEKASYPVFFDEKDFEDIEKKEKKEEKVEVKKEKVIEQPKEVYKEYRDPYSYKKEEKKHFHPTPIISPVYGVLDKNYKKDDIIDKPKKSLHKDSSMTIDDVRNKAYGTLEDELESTLFGKTSILFAAKEETDYDKIENELDDAAEALDLLREDHIIPKREENKKVENVQDKKEEAPKKEVTAMEDLLIDDDDDIIPTMTDEDDLGDNMVEDALGQDIDDKLSEDDLFNLIDNMN